MNLFDFKDSTAYTRYLTQLAGRYLQGDATSDYLIAEAKMYLKGCIKATAVMMTDLNILNMALKKEEKIPIMAMVNCSYNAVLRTASEQNSLFWWRNGKCLDFSNTTLDHKKVIASAKKAFSLLGDKPAKTDIALFFETVAANFQAVDLYERALNGIVGKDIDKFISGQGYELLDTMQPPFDVNETMAEFS